MNKPQPLAVGDVLPDIALELPNGDTVRPSAFKGNPAVFFFYPKDDTPGCTTEAKDFSELRQQFDAANVALLGISKDPPQKHRKFIEKHGLTVQLATDAAEGGLSDVLGIWTQKQMYGKTYMGMVRSTYLLDAQRRIVQIWPKVKVRGHAHEVLDAARTL